MGRPRPSFSRLPTCFPQRGHVPGHQVTCVFKGPRQGAGSPPEAGRHLIVHPASGPGAVWGWPYLPRRLSRALPGGTAWPSVLFPDLKDWARNGGQSYIVLALLSFPTPARGGVGFWGGPGGAGSERQTSLPLTLALAKLTLPIGTPWTRIWRRSICPYGRVSPQGQSTAWRSVPFLRTGSGVACAASR